MLAAFHPVLAGGWLATVLVEALFERALLGRGPEAELALARLHWRVDQWIEVPLLVGVVLTGEHRLAGQPLAGLLALKLAFALVAVLANLWCVWLVRQRLAAAEAGDWGRFRQLDHRQHQWGAVVLVGLLGAAGLGLWPA